MTDSDLTVKGQAASKCRRETVRRKWKEAFNTYEFNKNEMISASEENISNNITPYITQH